MNVFYHISPYPALLENMVAKIYEAQSPLAEVGSVTLPTPHTSPVSVSFTGLDKVTHIIKLFGAVSGTLLHNYDIQPTADVITVFDPIHFRIGDGGLNTPALFADTYTNSVMAGLLATDYLVYRKGQGFLTEAIDINNNVTLGGFTLATEGDSFQDQEDFIIQRIPKAIATPVNDSVVGKIFGGFVNVNTLTDYIPGHLRKLIRLSGTAAWYRFPAALGLNVPIGYSHRVTNFGVTGETAKVIFDNATLLWGGSPKTFLDIPFSATCEFTFDGTNWNCVMYNSVAPTAATPVGIISYIGSASIGNVAGSDMLVNIPIPDQLTTNYRILGNLIGIGSNWNDDNDVMFILVQKTATAFKIALREVSNGNQNLVFEYVIIK